MKKFARSLGKIIASGFLMLSLAGVSGCASFLEGVRVAGELLLFAGSVAVDMKEVDEENEKYQEIESKHGWIAAEEYRDKREEGREEREKDNEAFRDFMLDMWNSGIDSLKERVEKEPVEKEKVEKEKEKEKTPNSLPRIWPDVSTGL